MAVPHAVKDISQNQDVPTQVEPHQQDNHRGQGPVNQGVPGRQADKPGKQGGGGHKGHGGQKGPCKDRRPWPASGRGHPVHQQDKKEHQQEQQQKAEEEKLKQEANAAIENLEQVKKKAEEESRAAETTAAAKETTAAAKETTKASETSYSGTIEANPSESKAAETKAAAKETTKAAETKAPTTAAATKATTASGVGPGGGPGTGGTSSSGNEVTNATRSAVVAYAKQFLGNPYVYGGTSLTNGADCSGFTMSVFAHFGISTGRSSRDQAAKGKEVAVSAVQPGDLLFYASGNYINHVALYIGNGQVIHASTAKSGIKISPSNYRTPCKAVSFLN